MASRCGCTPFIDSSRPIERHGLVGHPHEQVGLLASARAAARSTLREQQQLRHGLDVVDDVVELLGQGVDVLAVERRDEGRVEPLEDRAGDLVALVLALVDPLVPRRCRRR